MPIENKKGRWTQGLSRQLPNLILLLFLLQPLMDILSYWMDRFGLSNMPTLLLRFAVLAVVALTGFLVSKQKKIYFIFAGVCAFLVLGHSIACFAVGYLDIVTDLTNFIRVAQMPLFAICLISYLRANPKCYAAMEHGLILNFCLISLSVIVSYVTGTFEYTYLESKIGIIGWFATGNAQSAVMSLLCPIVVVLCYRRRNLLLFIPTTLLAFVQLYLIGTRLAFFTILVIAFGLILVAFLSHRVHLPSLIAVFLLALVCIGTYKLSPMYRMQHIYDAAMASKQGDANIMMERAMEEEDDEQQEDPEETDLTEEELLLRNKKRMRGLRVIYRYYATDMSERFGVDRVIEAYNYTSQIPTITAARPRKIMFCRLLLDEHSWVSHLFGMELSRMSFNGKNYDVENDFHGIFFLYGWAGLAAMLAFIGYFVYLIIRSLIHNFKRYFTIEAGAYGMAFCLCMIYAYCTAGVLRRPNASFYLSVLLAAIYYLTQLREYPEEVPEQ